MGTVIINGVTYTGNTIIIDNNDVIIDGKTQYKSTPNDVVKVSIIGDVQNITCNGDVEVKGDVEGNIECAGNCTIKGDIGRNVHCMGNCTAKKVNGDINAMGNVFRK